MIHLGKFARGSVAGVEIFALTVASSLSKTATNTCEQKNEHALAENFQRVQLSAAQNQLGYI